MNWHSFSIDLALILTKYWKPLGQNGIFCLSVQDWLDGIALDPYYLTQKAEDIGYYPEMILAGRRINDNMGFYVATEVIKQMVQKRIQITVANVLVMELTF